MAASDIITVADLQIFEPDIDPAKAKAMIDDAYALAVRVAPCLGDDPLDPAVAAAAKAIIRRAILRWSEQGGGGLTTKQELAGPFSHMEVYDNRSTKGRLFWPSEITDLQDLCKTATTSSGAFSIDTAPGAGMATHADICSLRFGAQYCSCGADIAGAPLYEV